MWWFLYGLIVGAGVMRLWFSAQQGTITMAWYGWLICAVTVALGALTLQHFFASFKELEPRAAWMGLLFMGVPTLVLAGVFFWLVLA